MYRTTPYSEGRSDTKILFVAEAPGAEEMRRQRPLVGPTGRIFNDCLHKAGLIRAEVAIANVCRERIKAVSEYLHLKKGTFTQKGLEAQRDILERVSEHKANVIVPMGALALACLRPESQGRILKFRGSILESTTLPGRKILPTLHPAATLPGRGPYVYQYTITRDYKKVLRESEYPEIRRPDRTLITEPTFQAVVDYLHNCMDAEKVGADIETYNYQVSCISFAPTPLLSMSIPFVGRYAGEHYWTLEEEAAIWRLIAELGRKVTTVWQGGVSFDLPLLLFQNRCHFARIEDTMVRHRILFPDFPAKLEYICSTFTEEPYYKDDRKLWMTPARDPDKFWRYNARDSAVTREAEDPLCELINSDPDYKWTYENTMASVEPCLYAGLRGLRVDKDELETLRKSTEKHIKEKQAELDAICGESLNVNSSDQCIKYFYVKRGLKPYMAKRGNGKYTPTCDDKALARIIRRDNLPEARLVQEIRNSRKLLSTYIEVEFDSDGRLRTSYDVRGTSTGRYSSRKTPWDTGLNMQNLDPRIKGFLVPDLEEEDGIQGE